ncbi:MAG: 50S ribosomal protein L35 [Planctomycetaceae bacterium]|nr:50S ribosomal protein L35 [Planctomycetaceae bacterium]
MPKQKTNKSVAKRLKVTGRGKLMRHRAGAGHLKSVKSPSRIRRLRRETMLASNYTKLARRLLGI